MAATGAPADEAIKTTSEPMDTTLDEIEKMLLRLPSRCIIPISSNIVHTAESPVTTTGNSTCEHHNCSTSPSLTTAVSPVVKTFVSPIARTAHSTNGQRSQSTSSSIHSVVSPMKLIATSPVNRQPVCPNTVPPTRPQSFVLPQLRTSTPILRRLTQSSSSSAMHTAISPVARTARSPNAETAVSPTAKTAHSASEIVDVTGAFVLQGPVTITSHENVTKREDGLVYMNELIELRGAGATGMPGNELQPRIYSRATPTSAKEAVDFKETVKVGDNVVRIQRWTALNPTGPPSKKLSEYALSELRIYPHDGSSAQTFSANDVPDQLVRTSSERDGGGVDIELNINVKRNKGISTTSIKIKCDSPDFIPSKVWVNDRQVWAATTDN